MFTYLVFISMVVGMVAYDLAKSSRSPMTLRSAVRWSLFYIGGAGVFATWIFLARGAHQAELFLAGFLMEKALSVDNLLVFGLVFVYFGIRAEDQRKVLYSGFVGAAVFRLVFVTAGVVSLWLFGRVAEIAFGGIILVSAIKILRGSDMAQQIDHEKKWYVRWVKKLMPFTSAYSSKFFESGKATRLLLCAVALEFTDLAFSFDSVPTVIAVSQDPAIIYSSMVFAILGLRSLYFVLEQAKHYLVFLDKAVTCVLMFVGAKLVIHALSGHSIGPLFSLLVITIIFGVATFASAFVDPPDSFSKPEVKKA